MRAIFLSICQLKVLKILDSFGSFLYLRNREWFMCKAFCPIAKLVTSLIIQGAFSKMFLNPLTCAHAFRLYNVRIPDFNDII